MGVSASSLLDEAQSSYIKGQAEAELQALAPYYRRQFSIARFQQVEEELEQRRETPTQLLMQKAPPEAEVLYEEHLLYFEENRKWRDRYVVVRANHSLECHDSLETFVRGLPPRHKLLPTGGAVLTEEDAYAALVERCFPGDGGPKEDVAPPLRAMPGPFPLYLRLPYRRDCYFCFKQEAKRRGFASVLSDCIRHQNQDFLKKKTCEVQAFLKAVQLRRRDQGSYGPWDMLMGSDVRVMGNLVMEKLLPALEEDLLPRLKARRTERKRLWFATVEAAYILAQEHLLEGLARLKEECRAGARQQEVRIRADMDQILQSRRQLEDRVRAVVTEPAEKLCSESVRPYLDSVLEELMEPISCGFQEGRELLEGLMEEACRSARRGGQEDARKVRTGHMITRLSGSATHQPVDLLSCYQKIAAVRENQQNLQVRFGFSHPTGLIHSTQMDLEQLMENAAFTFEQLLYTTSRDDVGSAPEKAKERVLKRYDGDSSAVRKRICRQALLSVTLPFVQKELDAALKEEIRNLEEVLDPEHSSFVHVQNVYESILQQTLDEALTQGESAAAL
uniref:Niban apoptosis regulator 1a n=1 Tax=Tetraodon nigroviridis TaxID=99883 RepID=H3CJ05_TETNG